MQNLQKERRTSSNHHFPASCYTSGVCRKNWCHVKVEAEAHSPLFETSMSNSYRESVRETQWERAERNVEIGRWERVRCNFAVTPLEFPKTNSWNPKLFGLEHDFSSFRDDFQDPAASFGGVGVSPWIWSHQIWIAFSEAHRWWTWAIHSNCLGCSCSYGWA